MATTRNKEKDVNAESKDQEVKETAKEAKEAAKETEVKEESSTAVAVATENEWSEYNLNDLGFDESELDGLTGLDAVNASDIRVPFAKFWAVTKDGFNMGDIQLPGVQPNTEDVIQGLKDGKLTGLSILKFQTVRVMFPQPYKPTNSFTCRSLDGKVGALDGEYAGKACAECEFSKYPEAGGSSPCREQMLLLCTLPDGTLFHLLVSGISVGHFKKEFLSTEMMKGLAIVKKVLKRSILGALNVDLSVSEQNTDYGQKPYMVFKLNKDNPLQPMPRIKANLDSYSSYKEFEDEAVASAATFASTEQTEYTEEDGTGENKGLF